MVKYGQSFTTEYPRECVTGHIESTKNKINLNLDNSFCTIMVIHYPVNKHMSSWRALFFQAF